MDLRQHIRVISGPQDHRTDGRAQPRRGIYAAAAGMVVALLLGAAVGRALPGRPDVASSTQGATAAAEPAATFVYFPSQYVSQPIESEQWEHIPTF